MATQTRKKTTRKAASSAASTAPAAAASRKKTASKKATARKKTTREAVSTVPASAASTAPAAVASRKKAASKKPTARKKAAGRSTPSPSPVAQVANVRLLQLHLPGTPQPEPEAGFEARSIHPDDNPLLEVSSFLRLHKLPELQAADLWGAFPSDFARRTGLDADSVRQVIAENPGYDLYFCNPNPDTEALFHNLWMKGETSHPDFLRLARAFLSAGGLDEDLIHAVTPARLFAAGQMIVATPVFWAEYLRFVGETLAQVQRNLSPDLQAMLNSTKADPRGLHHGSTYLRFILERLFSVYLIQQESTWRAYKFVAPLPEQKLNMHLRLLRELKERAIDERSTWHAACWINYRALYLLEVYKQTWCERYLQRITPDTLTFALPTADIRYAPGLTSGAQSLPSSSANDA